MIYIFKFLEGLVFMPILFIYIKIYILGGLNNDY